MKLKPIKIKPDAPAELRPDDNPTFDKWLTRVDRLLVKHTGISYKDLPDQPFRDWYDRRILPIRAANKLITVINREFIGE